MPNTKNAFDRIDAEGVSAALERGERGAKSRGEYDGSVYRGEAQLLLADAGEVMSKLRVRQPIVKACSPFSCSPALSLATKARILIANVDFDYMAHTS